MKTTAVLCILTFALPLIAAPTKDSNKESQTIIGSQRNSTTLSLQETLTLSRQDIESNEHLYLNLGQDQGDAEEENYAISDVEYFTNALDERADSIMAQYPESVQKIVRKAYYYNIGLNGDTTRRTYESGELLNFGKIELEDSSQQFTINWPSFLKDYPIIDRMIKLEKIVLELGLTLRETAHEEDHVRKTQILEHNKYRLKIANEIYKTSLQSLLTQIVDPFYISEELETMSKTNISKTDYEALVLHLQQYNNLDESVLKRINLILAEIQKNTNQVEMVDVNSEVLNMFNIVSDRASQAMFVDYDKMRDQMIENIIDDINKSTNAPGNEAFKEGDLVRLQARALLSKDKLALIAIDKISHENSDAYNPCISHLLH